MRAGETKEGCAVAIPSRIVPKESTTLLQYSALQTLCRAFGRSRTYRLQAFCPGQLQPGTGRHLNGRGKLPCHIRAVRPGLGLLAPGQQRAVSPALAQVNRQPERCAAGVSNRGHHKAAEQYPMRNHIRRQPPGRPLPCTRRLLLQHVEHCRHVHVINMA